MIKRFSSGHLAVLVMTLEPLQQPIHPVLSVLRRHGLTLYLMKLRVTVFLQLLDLLLVRFVTIATEMLCMSCDSNALTSRERMEVIEFL
jgi:hypothetical protein